MRKKWPWCRPSVCGLMFWGLEFGTLAVAILVFWSLRGLYLDEGVELYYCLLDYKWNHNVQNEHPFLLKKTWNKLLWKQFTEVQIEWDVGSFILHRLPYIRLLFETKCVVSFWTCKLKTKLVHWLYFSDPAAICLYSLYLLHVIVTWPKFQFETFTWPLC